MRPTFLGFETARKGLVSNQKGMDIVGQNLTNVRTPGYTRQRVDLASMSISSTGSRYAMKQSSLSGQGVNINGISQVRDKYLDKRFREEFSDVGYYDQNSLILGDIESALDEVTSNGMKNALKNMMTSLQNFSKNPDQVTHANITLTAAKNLTAVFKQFDVKLNNILEQQKFDLGIKVNDANSLMEKIANLNKSISAEVFVTGSMTNEYYGPNELLDQRNLLLDELSRYGDLKVEHQTDGTVSVTMNDILVIEKDKSEELAYTRNEDKTVSLTWRSSGDDVDLLTGSLKSSIEMINGRGMNAGAGSENERFDKGVPYYKDKIDALAFEFANKFNTTLLDSEGKYKTLFTSTDDGPITAANISISEQWNKSPGYIIAQNSLNKPIVEFTPGYVRSDLDGIDMSTFNDWSTKDSIVVDGYHLSLDWSTLTRAEKDSLNLNWQVDPTVSAGSAEEAARIIGKVINGAIDKYNTDKKTTLNNVSVTTAGTAGTSKEFTITSRGVRVDGVGGNSTVEPIVSGGFLGKLFGNQTNQKAEPAEPVYIGDINELNNQDMNISIDGYEYVLTLGTISTNPPPAGPGHTIKDVIQKLNDKIDKMADDYDSKKGNPPGTTAALLEFKINDNGRIKLENKTSPQISVDTSERNNGNMVQLLGIFSEDGKIDGELDNKHILALINSFNEDMSFGAEFKGTFEQYVNFYNTALGQQREYNVSRLDATAAIADDLLNRRDAISGVSMDEEGADLMEYDKAYKAVSRVMTALDEMLDVLINKVGLVGR